MSGANSDGGHTIQETIQDARSGLAESLPCPGPHRLRSALVGIAPCRREAAEDAYRSDCGKHGKVMSVHLIFQGSLANLIEAAKLERNPTPVRVDQAVKTYGQS